MRKSVDDIIRKYIRYLNAQNLAIPYLSKYLA
jgi:hypothetical protein